MKVLVADRWPNPDEAQRYTSRIALILGLSILGIAGVYFGALYLIAR